MIRRIRWVSLPLLVAGAFAVLFLVGTADAKPPLPDHPITGKPVQPTWSYWRIQSGPGWTLTCWVPVRAATRCSVTLWWDATL